MDLERQAIILYACWNSERQAVIADACWEGSCMQAVTVDAFCVVSLTQTVVIIDTCCGDFVRHADLHPRVAFLCHEGLEKTGEDD